MRKVLLFDDESMLVVLYLHPAAQWPEVFGPFQTEQEQVDWTEKRQAEGWAGSFLITEMDPASLRRYNP